MSVIARLLPDNPVLTKEMRVRMRGARAYWLLAGYVGFLSLVLLFLYYGWQNTVARAGVGGSESARVGAEIFTWVLITQIFLALFITPAITSGAITIENEQRTMDMLTMSRMRRSSIVLGKLLAAIAFTALLLVSSLPLVSISFLLGSVDPAMVAGTYAMLLMGSVFVGAMGLAWSSIARSTTAAVMYTYGSVFVLGLVSTFVYGMNVNPFFGGSPLMTVWRGIGVTWFGGSYLGVKTLEGTGFCVYCVVFGWLMAALAMARIETYPERRGGLLRGLTLLLFTSLLLAMNVWWLQGWYGRAGMAPTTMGGARMAFTGLMAGASAPPGMLIGAVWLLMLAIPIFATGDLTARDAASWGKTLLSGWTPRGLRTGKLASGLPFVLCLTLFCLVLYAVSFVWVGQAGDIAHSSPTARQSVTVPDPGTLNQYTPGTSPGTGVAKPVKTLTLPPAGDFPHAAFMLLAFAFGLGSLCLLLSVAFRSRWAAWFVMYAFLMVVWVLPAQTYAAISENAPPGWGIYFYFLNPSFALFQMSDPNSYLVSMRQAPLLLRALYPVTSVCWLVIGLLSLVATVPFARHLGRKAA